MPKIKISSEQRAVILAGGDELDLGEATPAAGTAAAPATPSSPGEPAPAATTAAPAAPAAAPAAPAAPAAELVSFLQAQVAEKDAALLAANVKVATLEASARDATDNLPGLLAIAHGVIGAMQVALGSSDTAKALNAKDAVAEHARLSPVYTERFKVGGIASTQTEPAAKAEVHPLFAQRLAARSTASK
jgi:hypothetical protein